MWVLSSTNTDIYYAQTIMSGMGELHLEIYAEVGVFSSADTLHYVFLCVCSV